MFFVRQDLAHLGAVCAVLGGYDVDQVSDAGELPAILRDPLGADPVVQAVLIVFDMAHEITTLGEQLVASVVDCFFHGAPRLIAV